MSVNLNEERVSIRGVTLFGRHGVRDEERQHGQMFNVDIELVLDRPSDADDLEATIDYTAVIERVRALNETSSYQLIESFSRAVARDLLEHFQMAQAVRVRVGKQLKKLGLGLEGVSAEVCLHRNDEGRDSQ